MVNARTFFRNFFLTRRLYSCLHDMRLQKRLKKMQTEGYDVIQSVQKMLSEQGCVFFFDMGTLLGIVREGRILEHDLDIDIGVFAEDPIEQQAIREHLLGNGCKLVRSCYVNDIGLTQESYKLNDIKFDLEYYYRLHEGIDSCFLFVPINIGNQKPENRDVLELQCERISNTKKVLFSGEYVNIPEEAEHYLEQRYGEKWRIPDKNYKYWLGPSTYPFASKGHVETGI